jgi:hypothetical protein
MRPFALAVLLVPLLALGVAPSAHAGRVSAHHARQQARHREQARQREREHSHRAVAQTSEAGEGSEARVRQIPNNAMLPLGKKAPESAPPVASKTNAAAARAPDCTGKNASTPACYSATQQARPLTR